jgi:hypothetical protein
VVAVRVIDRPSSQDVGVAHTAIPDSYVQACATRGSRDTSGMRGDASATRYGAVLGAVAGLAASGLVAVIYGYFAYGRATPNPDGALAGSALLSSVAGFPGSLATFAVAERFSLYGSTALRVVVFLTPLVNWLFLGVAAGLVVDLGRWLASRGKGRPGG